MKSSDKSKERLFIAAQLTPSQLDTLNKMQSQLIKQAKSYRLTKAQNFHLTLRFLGDCTLRQRESIIQGWEGLKRSIGPSLRSRILDSGSFSRSEGSLIFARFEVSQAFTAFVTELDAILAEAGFEPEKKRWLPHVTLARNVFPSEQKALSVEGDPLWESVPSICLMRSEFTDQGMRYTPIYRWDITNRAAEIKPDPERRKDDAKNHHRDGA